MQLTWIFIFPVLFCGFLCEAGKYPSPGMKNTIRGDRPIFQYTMTAPLRTTTSLTTPPTIRKIRRSDPECSSNSNCPDNMFCNGEKCVDSCPGACGINAICIASNHVPVCSCPQETNGGDPFIICKP